MSILLTLDSTQVAGATSDDFRVSYYAPIELGDANWEVGLVSANLWYSFYNIAAEYSNNTLEYSIDSGANWTTITIPDGAYQITQIDAEIKRQMKDNGHFDNSDVNNPKYYISIEPDYPTSKVRIVITNPTYQVDLSTGSLHSLLGFAAAVVSSTSVGNTVADITRGLNTINIRCDVVDGSYNNGLAGDIIYNFVPDTIPGGNISVVPNERIYIPVRRQTQIQNIRIYLADNQNRRVNLNGEPTTYLLHMRLAARQQPAK